MLSHSICICEKETVEERRELWGRSRLIGTSKMKMQVSRLEGAGSGMLTIRPAA